MSTSPASSATRSPTASTASNPSVRTRFATSSSSDADNEGTIQQDRDCQTALGILGLRFEQVLATVNRKIRLFPPIPHDVREKVVTYLKPTFDQFSKAIISTKEELLDAMKKERESKKFVPACPICTTTLLDPLMTNCGHICCRKCFVNGQVPEYTSPNDNNPPQCFLCRSSVFKLTKVYLPEYKQQ